MKYKSAGDVHHGKAGKTASAKSICPLSCRLYRQLFLCVFHQSKRDLADDRRTDSFEPTPEKRDEVCFSAVFKGYMKWSYFIRRVKWQQQALKWS